MSNDRYEYRVFSPNSFATPEDMEISMNSLGEAGFRFISVFTYGSSNMLLFSKPKFMKMPYSQNREQTGKYQPRGGSF